MPPTTPPFTSAGTWDSSTRQIPALAFIEQYAKQVDSLDLSGPFHDWYAPSSIFYNGNGTVYTGGDEIWTWMKGLFGPFSALHHEITRIRLLDEVAIVAGSEKPAQQIILEAQTHFTVKGLEPIGTPIVVPRLLMFLVGASEVSGQGTDGLQILEAKAFWDTGELGKRIRERKEAASHS